MNLKNNCEAAEWTRLPRPRGDEPPTNAVDEDGLPAAPPTRG